ncbi:MAG TPA: right-handed parallel beta-helix repeat-containing protein, partial [Synergistales bacterium]|nr:right-handed parallel beta-helix repeat-containing protein [Synergistales bacterium]
VSGNSGGGGIHNGRTMTLNNCVIKDNSSSGSIKAGGISSTDYGYDATTLTMRNCVVENNTCTDGIAGGIYNGVKGTLTMYRCIVRRNSLSSMGGGLYISSSTTTHLADYCQVTENTPDQICCAYGVTYTTDGTCTIGDTAGKSAVALSGAAEGSSVKPRNTTGEADVTKVENDLKNRESAIFREAENLLSTDLGGLPGGAAATLYDAFAYENVPLADTSGKGELEVQFTASWPMNARYYAALAEYEDAAAGVQAVKEYVIPERSVHFEIKPGQPLPDGVTPPDFYEEGEGLMTWRNVVEDNGPFDHNPTVGVVTFRVASIRAEAQSASSGGSGCSAVGASPLALLMALPLLFLRKQ